MLVFSAVIYVHLAAITSLLFHSFKVRSPITSKKDARSDKFIVSYL
jgi:hypothetical protein